jgi:hypothetical protein
MTRAVDDQLARLETMAPVELRSTWRTLTGGPAPRISPKLLRIALAWEIQARAFGGLSRETIRQLDQIACGKTSTVPAAPGMQLVREWQGKVHVVNVDDSGTVQWEERSYRSLSEVARAITGTRWSGPAFFGLKRKVAA